ncbi:hypothetical protein PJO24_004922 [Salmonella enterica]|nr:hypothetical protein [Salmonella enterica]
METAEAGKDGDRENLIFMDEEELKIIFDHNGRLIHSLKLRVCGDIKMAESIFENNLLPVRTECQYEAHYYFYLQPESTAGTEKRENFLMIGVDLHEGLDLLSARYFVVHRTTANTSGTGNCTR